MSTSGPAATPPALTTRQGELEGEMTDVAKDMLGLSGILRPNINTENIYFENRSKFLVSAVKT